MSRFEEIFRDALACLHSDLECLEQTTHVHLCQGSPYADFIICLTEALEDSSGYRVSNLSQSLERLLSKSLEDWMVVGR